MTTDSGTLHATTWQTVGPFFKIGLAWLYREDLAGANVSGERIEISGRVFDGDGNTVPDAVLELWQANSQGKYAHPEDEQNKSVDAGFSGFGRIATDDQGRFRFKTIKPGQVPAPETSGKAVEAWAPLQAPHINVSICTRGLLRRLVSRIAPLRPLPVVETYESARALVADSDKAALAYVEAIDAAIANDLATPKLLATLQEALRDPDITVDGLRVVVAAADALLGLRLADLDPAEVDRRRTAPDLAPEELAAIERLVAERTQARKEKNWSRADEIRAELDALGVQVTDTATGPTWQLR